MEQEEKKKPTYEEKKEESPKPVDNMYNDPRRNQKPAKPISWEEIQDQHWTAADSRVSNLKYASNDYFSIM